LLAEGVRTTPGDLVGEAGAGDDSGDARAVEAYVDGPSRVGLPPAHVPQAIR
jgi:hypothetical protein